jgi:hypothetical protein
MNYVLKRDPVWMESLPLLHASGTIDLLSGDGCHVSVPTALLLAPSKLVRNILTDLLPPAYIPLVLSLPSVTGEVLQVVGELLATGTASVNTDRMREEVNMVFKMMQIQALLVSCQFDSILLVWDLL